jgi:hypothetical protein
MPKTKHQPSNCPTKIRRSVAEAGHDYQPESNPARFALRGGESVSIAPVFNLPVSDSVQRDNLVWMVVVGTAASEIWERNLGASAKKVSRV